MSKAKAKEKKKKKVGRKPLGKKTQVMRISRKSYDFLRGIKGKLTYDELFEEVLQARELVSNARKVFLVEGKVLEGFTLEQARKVAQNFSESPLRILLDVGEDS